MSYDVHVVYHSVGIEFNIVCNYFLNTPPMYTQEVICIYIHILFYIWRCLSILWEKRNYPHIKKRKTTIYDTFQMIRTSCFFHHPIFLSGRCWEQSSIRWSLRPGRVDTGVTYNAPTCHQSIMKPTTAIHLGVDATKKIEGGSKQKKVNGWLNNFVVLRSLFFCLDWMLFLMNFGGPWNPLSFRHPAFGFPKKETLPWCLEKMAINVTDPKPARKKQSTRDHKPERLHVQVDFEHIMCGILCFYTTYIVDDASRRL